MTALLEGVAQSKAKHEDPGPTNIFTNMKKNCLQEENGSPSRFNLPKQQWLKMVYYGKPRAHLMHLRHLDKDNIEAPVPIKNEATKVLNRGRKNVYKRRRLGLPTLRSVYLNSSGSKRSIMVSQGNF